MVTEVILPADGVLNVLEVNTIPIIVENNLSNTTIGPANLQVILIIIQEIKQMMLTEAVTKSNSNPHGRIKQYTTVMSILLGDLILIIQQWIPPILLQMQK